MLACRKFQLTLMTQGRDDFVQRQARRVVDRDHLIKWSWGDDQRRVGKKGSMGEPGRLQLAVHAKRDELRNDGADDPEVELAATGTADPKMLQWEAFVGLSEARRRFDEAEKEQN